MTIHTTARQRTNRRRLDRLGASVDRVMAALRGGAVLQLSYGRRSAHWTLSNAIPVDDAVARLVIKNPNVVDVGDALFAEALAQTWRFSEGGSNGR